MSDYAPQEICDQLVYRPDWESEYQIWGPQVLASRVVDLLRSSKFVHLNTKVTEGEMDGRQGFLIGWRDLNNKPEILEVFRKTGDEAAMNNHFHPKVLGSRRQEELGSRLRWPFHILVNIGDHIFISGASRTTVSVYAGNYCKYMAPDKMIRCFEVPGGVVVMLVWAEGALIDESRIINNE